MIRCACPHCRATFQVENGGAGKKLPCPNCERRVRIPGEVPPFVLAADGPRRRRRRKSWLLPASLISGFVGLALCCGVLGAIGSRLPPPDPQPLHLRGIQPDRDPYAPDCAIIRRWLREHYGEVEIVSWGQRTIVNAGFGGHVYLSVRFTLGNGVTMRGSFTIGPGNIVETSVIDD